MLREGDPPNMGQEREDAFSGAGWAKAGREQARQAMSDAATRKR